MVRPDDPPFFPYPRNMTSSIVAQLLLCPDVFYEFDFENRKRKKKRAAMKMPCRDINRADEFNMNHAVNIRSAFARYCLRTQQLACHVTLISKRLFFFVFLSFHFMFLADNHQKAGGEGSTSACDPSTQVACRNHPSICIEVERVQDGVADCPDASDEGESN